MAARKIRTWLPLLFIFAAPSFAADNYASKESMDSFLSNVKEFAYGQSTVSTPNSATPSSPAWNGRAASSNGPSIGVLNTAQPTFTPRRLSGGTIEHKTLTPYSISPNSSASPWR